MLAVSTDDLRDAEYAVESFGVPFPVLYTAEDPSVPSKYGVFNLYRDGLATPSIFIIDKQGRLAWKAVSDVYYHRVPTDVIIGELEKIQGGSS